TLLPRLTPLPVGFEAALVILALAALASRYGLTQLERKFYEGRTVPPRNLPESQSTGGKR
ncbi:MAG: hypothetical protein HC857_04430, partial [Synechococcales cyanobacterium RU_4_20]|nr:hypothetical protein [Synechococcales cyanobacterium RU_4_20]